MLSSIENPHFCDNIMERGIRVLFRKGNWIVRFPIVVKNNV